MPTILQILGWRLYFYANENQEPPHVHARKGGCECKYWLRRDSYDIEEAFNYGLSPRDTRQIRKIIFDNFDYILERWDEFDKRKLP
jgi:hypothetical protein